MLPAVETGETPTRYPRRVGVSVVLVRMGLEAAGVSRRRVFRTQTGPAEGEGLQRLILSLRALQQSHRLIAFYSLGGKLTNHPLTLPVSRVLSQYRVHLAFVQASYDRPVGRQVFPLLSHREA